MDKWVPVGQLIFLAYARDEDANGEIAGRVRRAHARLGYH